MSSRIRYFSLLLIALIMLACNFVSINIESTPPVQPTETLLEDTPSSSPPTATAEPVGNQPPEVLDPCSLVTQAEAETILGEPANPPVVMSGSCNFTNAKDSLYAISVAAAQGQEADGILQGQAMLLGFAGAKLDDARMNNLRSLAAAQDYSGFFSELITAAEIAPNIKARLVEDPDSDLVYWAWISAPPRVQGAYVAVRGPTLVSINLILADTRGEESVLSAAAPLAGKIFPILPGRFSLPVPTAAPAPTEAPTAVPTPTYVGLAPPELLAPQNGVVIDAYPRNMTLQWSAVQGAVKYIVEVEACSNANPNDCFSLINSETAAVFFNLDFVGMQPGRWRVRAVDGSGQPGAFSDWRQFTYTR